MRILAADIGFGYTKATDGRQTQVFKSIVGEANPVQFAEALLPVQAASPRHFVINGEDLYVGELAETQSRGRGTSLDPTQFIAQYARTLGLAALAPFAEHGDPIRLVTGLPISFFRKHKDALTTVLQNRHAITVVHGNGEREDKTLYIEKVRVIPQPFGSLFNLMLNEQGKAIHQRFVTEKIGIIDIGFRTADFAVADKTKYSERGSLSTDSGMSVAYHAIANVLHEKSGTQIELYRLHDAITRGTIKIRGQRFDITGLVNQAFGQLATRIAAEANRLWADDWDIDCIVLTGGGGATLAAQLTPLIQGEVLPLPAEQDARFNNVAGYLKYGANLWSA
ncbi:ParM/StbA family protein [Nevskia sp.]|uniref:ParM/StbA family protein n=1 Tax=Nevskia sp. TaxID=1929292 RepID=UPI0025FA9954|nr:ParM/StbA family protein [Nevskia sp.]